MKHELRHMRGQGSGAIVNCSSQSGLVGIAGLGAYTASKHAVIGLTKSAALEYADRGIRINAVCPGPVDTPMVANALVSAPERMKQVIKGIPIGRLGKPDEVASAVLWLCSPGAGFAIGHALVVDGGKDVAFESVNGEINGRIDDAYREKYKSSPYLKPMISERARAATVKVAPRLTTK